LKSVVFLVDENDNSKVTAMLTFDSDVKKGTGKFSLSNVASGKLVASISADESKVEVDGKQVLVSFAHISLPQGKYVMHFQSGVLKGLSDDKPVAAELLDRHTVKIAARQATDSASMNSLMGVIVCALLSMELSSV